MKYFIIIWLSFLSLTLLNIIQRNAIRYIYDAFNLATSATASMLLYLHHCTVHHKTRNSTDHVKRTDRCYIWFSIASFFIQLHLTLPIIFPHLFVTSSSSFPLHWYFTCLTLALKIISVLRGAPRVFTIMRWKWQVLRCDRKHTVQFRGLYLKSTLGPLSTVPRSKAMPMRCISLCSHNYYSSHHK